jgi:hypothetical protein
MSGADHCPRCWGFVLGYLSDGNSGRETPGAAPESPRTSILSERPNPYAARVGASAAPPMRTVLAIESAT